MTLTATAAPALRARGLTLAYEDHVVFSDLDVAIEPGRITGLLGPNGCGKSTLLKAFGRILHPQAGAVEFEGVDISSVSTKQVARRLALLPQKPLTPSATSVRDLVARGRHPHQSLWRPWTAEDARIVAEALEATGLTDIADRDAGSLSGGQLQRVWIALVLAQQAGTVLLDEPTTFLDLGHQVEVLSLVEQVNRERGTTVVMVLHDLSLAARYCDRLILLSGGRVVADGKPWEVLTPETLLAAFGLRALVIPDPASETPLVVPLAQESQLRAA